MGSHNKEQLSYRRIPSSPPETNSGAHVTLFMLLPNSLSPPSMDQMSVSPQIHVLNPNPKMWWYLEIGTLGWLGHKNGALMNGISVLICAGKYLTQDSRNNWGLWEESWAKSSSLQDNWGANMRHSWWGEHHMAPMTEGWTKSPLLGCWPGQGHLRGNVDFAAKKCLSNNKISLSSPEKTCFLIGLIQIVSP